MKSQNVPEVEETPLVHEFVRLIEAVPPLQEFARLLKAMPPDERERLVCFLVDDAEREAARPRGQPWEEVGRAIHKERIADFDLR